jgi:hypothetical protein
MTRKISMKKTLLVTAVLAFSFLPLLASAASLPNVLSPTSIKGPLVTCTGSFFASTNDNTNLGTCQDLCDLVLTIVTDIYVGIAFVIWIILPISFVAGGIMYMLGGANPSLLTTAKSTLKGAVIGAIIVLCAYLLVATFVKFMNISNIGGFSSNASSVCTL